MHIYTVNIFNMVTDRAKITTSIKYVKYGLSIDIFRVDLGLF